MLLPVLRTPDLPSSLCSLSTQINRAGFLPGCEARTGSRDPVLTLLNPQFVPERPVPWTGLVVWDRITASQADEQGFPTLAQLIFVMGWFSEVGSWLVHGKMFSSIFNLCSLDSNSIPLPYKVVTTKNAFRHYQMASRFKKAPLENHWDRLSTKGKI